MSSLPPPSKPKSHGKVNIHLRIERLTLINNIINLNIPSETLSISPTDLKIFSYFIRTFREEKQRTNYILTSSNKYILPKSFYHPLPNITPSSPSSILLRFLIILITFCNFNPGYIDKDSLIIYKHIFTITKKLFIENIFNQNQLSSFLKYTIVLSFVHSNSKNYNRNGKTIFVWVIIFFSIQTIIEIIEYNKKHNKEQPIECIKETIEFLKNKILSNIHNVNYIRMFPKKVIFDLINHTNIETRDTIISFLTDIYQFGYDKNMLTYFLMKFKDILGSIETDNFNIIEQHIDILISHCKCIEIMHEKEIQYVKNDPFMLNRSFCLNDSQKTGIEYVVTNVDMFKKYLLIVFSFKMHYCKNGNAYPLIVFYNDESKIHILNIYIMDNKLYIVGKRKKEQTVVPINKILEIGKTYIVIIEHEKKVFGNRGWNVSINGESFTDIQIAFPINKFICRIGYDIINIGNDKNRLSFPGYIGTVIMFKKKVNNEFIKYLQYLGGYYDIILFLKGKNTNVNNYEKYLPNEITTSTKYKEAIEYFLNYDSVIHDNIGFYISPLAISQYFINKSFFEVNNKRKYLFTANIFMKHEEEFNSNPYFEIFEEPNIGDSIYMMENTYTFSSFIKYNGIRLLTLHIEYYYNILRKRNDINEHILLNISKGIINVIQILIKILKFVNYNSIKHECDGFGFSLAKTISLILDYQVLNRELALNLIDLLKEVNDAGIKAFNFKRRTLFTYRLFYFLIDPFKYNCNDFDLLRRLFEELNHCLKDNQLLVSIYTIKELFKFRFLYDYNEIDRFCNNKPNTTDPKSKEYKNVKKKYTGLLTTLIHISKNNMLLFDFLNEIFNEENEENILQLNTSDNEINSDKFDNNLINPNPIHFKANSMLVKYKLLKIYYLSKENRGNKDLSSSSSSSGIIIPIKSGKSAGNIPHQKKEDKLQNAYQINSLNKHELFHTYEKLLSHYQQISTSDTPDKYKESLELIKAILIRVIFEDTFQHKGNFCTINKDLHKDENDEEVNHKKRKRVNFNIFGRQSHHRKTSPNQIIETPDFMPSALRETFHTLQEEYQRKNEISVPNIQIIPPFSIHVLKSIFCCMFDGIWDNFEKLKFIKHHNKHPTQLSSYSLGEFYRPQKHLLLQYIKLLKLIDNNDILFNEAAHLICNYLDSTLDEFKQNKSKPQSKCKFIHIFESKQIFTKFFIYCLSRKHIISNNNFHWIYDKLITYVKYCFIYHPKPFIFPFIQSCIYKQVYDISILIQDISSFLSIENKDFWKKYSNDILTEKQEIHLSLNEYRLLETFRQIIDKASIKAYEFFNKNNKEVINYIIKIIETLFQSVIIYDSNIYFHVEILEHHRKDIVHCTLYESAIDLLFSLGTLFEKNENVNDISSLLITNELLTSIFSKTILNGHSLCFYLDLYNSTFSYNKKIITQYLVGLQDFDDIEAYTQIQNKIQIQNNIKNKHPFNHAFPKTEGGSNINNNLCFIYENKLLTIFTYILCIKYRKKAGESFLNNVIFQLQMDLHELYNIIEKFPKLNKSQLQIYYTINKRNKKEIHVYDKIISYLQKKKDFGSEKLNEIINHHITLHSSSGSSPINKAETKSPNANIKQSSEMSFTSTVNEAHKQKERTDIDNEDNISPSYGSPQSPNREKPKQLYSLSSDDENENDENDEIYKFYGIYRKDSFSNCGYHCNKKSYHNVHSENEIADNKNIIKAIRKDNRDISVKDISPSPNNIKNINNTMHKRSFSFTNEYEKYVRKYSLFDFDFDEAVLCVKRDILLRNFAFFFNEAFFINKKFCNMKNQFKYIFSPFDKMNNYFNQHNQENITYPSKVKNYHHYSSFYPKMFLRPDIKFFHRNIFFSLGHEYFKQQNESQYPDCKLQLEHGLLNQPNFELFSKHNEHNINDNNIFECEYNANDNVYYGNICIRNKYLIFQTDMNFDPKTEYITKTNYLYSSLEIDVIQIPKQIIICYRDIETIVNRRFVYMNQAIEIFCKNGKSYFFNLFKSEILTQFISILKAQHHLYWNEKILDYSDLYTKYNDKHIYSQEAIALSKQWKTNQISTTSYLLQLNKFAGRTYNDINQYPLMPWVLTDYSINDINNFIRSFDLPISAQKEEKKQKAIKRYENSDSKNHKCHFQIHYSNSSFVNSYMVRLAPFTYNQIKFQSNSFDKPNRQFHSFEEFCALLQEIFDNREMIPEMFLMIEQFYNLNYVNFGRRTSDKGLINIITGNGVGSTAMSFIFTHRTILDCYKVAIKLHHWIDNIFGVNQLTEKIDIINSFPKETYGKYMVTKFMKYEKKYGIDNDDIWISKVKAKCNSIITLGQTPCQLFYTPHVEFTLERIPQRNAMEEFDEFRERSHEQQLNILHTNQKEIYYIGITSEGNYFYLVSEKIIIKYTAAMKEYENIYIHPPEQINTYYINDSISSNDSYNVNTIMINNYLVFDIKDGTLFIMCSFYNKGINVYGSTDFSLTLLTDSYVTCLKKIRNKNIFYSGHKNGKISIWEYTNFDKNEDFKAKVKYDFIAHEGGVKAIEYSERHDIIISCGEEGKLMVRKMSTYELISVMFSPSMKDCFVHVVISEFDVIYAQIYNQNKKKFSLYGYTLNGLLFERTAHQKFLPIDVVKHENNVLFVQGHKIKFVTPDLQRTKEVEDVKKLIKKLDRRGSKIMKKGLDELDDYDVLAYIYSREKDLMYCVLKKFIVLRIPLGDK